MSYLKYVLVPGHVKSKTDGQVHWINSLMLSHLYKVKLSECTIRPEYDHRMPRHQAQFDERHADLVWLYPDESGRYEIPTTKGPKQ